MEHNFSLVTAESDGNLLQVCVAWYADTQK